MGNFQHGIFMQNVPPLDARHGVSGMSHTPGPWIVKRLEGTDRIWGIHAANGESIVEADAGCYPPTLEDAYLIAAAPDLLAACKELRKACAAAMRVMSALADALPEQRFFEELKNVGIKDGFGKRAQAAVAKAEGR